MNESWHERRACFLTSHIRDGILANGLLSIITVISPNAQLKNLLEFFVARNPQISTDNHPTHPLFNKFPSFFCTKKFRRKILPKNWGCIFCRFDGHKVFPVKHQRFLFNSICLDSLLDFFEAFGILTVSQNLLKLLPEDRIFFHNFPHMALLFIHNLIQISIYKIHYIIHRVMRVIDCFRIRSQVTWR